MGRWVPLTLSVLIVSNAAVARAQDNPTQDFTDWLNRRLQAAVAPVVGASTPGKQVETPSIADNSTALVDKAGAPDLIGIAMQFFNLGKDREGTLLPAYWALTDRLGRTPINGARTAPKPGLFHAQELDDRQPPATQCLC